MTHDGVEWRIHAEIPPAFPEAMPRVTLQVLAESPNWHADALNAAPCSQIIPQHSQVKDGSRTLPL